MGGAQGFKGVGEKIIVAEVAGFEGELQALQACIRSLVDHGMPPQHFRSILRPAAQ